MMSNPIPFDLLRAATRIAVLGAAIAAGGCASVGAPHAGVPLGERNAMSAGADGVRSWRSAAFPRQAAVCFGEVDVLFAPQVPVDDAERADLRAAIDAALAEQLASAGLRRAAVPCAAGDLRVRTTVEAVERARPWANVATALLLLAPLSRGGVTLQFEAVQVSDGRCVAAMALRARAGIEDAGSAFSALGHARSQAGPAAERFARLLAGG